MTADEYPGLRLGRIETKIPKRFKSIHRRLQFLHGINEKEEPVVLEDLRTLQCQRMGSLIVDETRMQGLHPIDERLFFVAPTLDHQDLLALRNDQLVAVRRRYLVPQVCKPRLKHQVVIPLGQIEAEGGRLILHRLHDPFLKLDRILTGQRHQFIFQVFGPGTCRDRLLAPRAKTLHHADPILVGP